MIFVDLKQWLIPHDKVFYDLFEAMGETVVKASEKLVAVIEHYGNIKGECKQMKDLEHAGDTLTHQIYEHLNRTFITPIEPEEISRLATALDDVLDCIEGSVAQMYNYGIGETDAPMLQFAKLIQLSATEMLGAIKGIRTLSNTREIEERCIEINRLENLADDVLAHALTDLFKTSDPIQIIKLKDIYENLESATDRCEDVANILSDIVIRHT